MPARRVPSEPVAPVEPVEPVVPVEDTHGNMPVLKPVVSRDDCTAPGADPDTDGDAT
jgi:hypothetical protein